MKARPYDLQREEAIVQETLSVGHFHSKAVWNNIYLQLRAPLILADAQADPRFYALITHELSAAGWGCR